MNPEALAAAKAAFEIEADAIRATGTAMDWPAFQQATAALAAAPRIATTGCGHSGIACMHFAHSLCCIERPARFLSPAEAVHGATGFLQPGDVLVAASRGGETAELLPIIAIARQKGATVITVTENRESTMAAQSHIVLPLKIPRETDKFNTQGTSSFTALAALFDALQTALLEETGFQNEQFALTHPGGAVGRRLNNG